jgi:integrase
VRVGTTGRISFFVMYRINGRRKRDTLGQFPIISLAEARQLARQRFAKLILEDENPHFTPTTNFGEAVADFVRLHCAVRNKPRTAGETERLLNRHWLPVLSRKTLQEIRTQDVSSVLDGLVGTPSIAVNALAAVRKFFNWARQRRLVAHSPCEGLQLGVRPQPRTRVLSDAELVKVYRAAERCGYPYGNIVQLLLLTAQRRTEIASLRWSYINQEERLITLPPELVKNNREHVFVYGDRAADVLERMPRIGDLLFPARGHHDRSFSGWSKSKRGLDRACAVEFTLHDLRRTWATRAANLGVHPWVIEAHLNHVSGIVSGVSAIYNRYSYLKEARLAVKLFEEHFASALRSMSDERRTLVSIVENAN